MVNVTETNREPDASFGAVSAEESVTANGTQYIGNYATEADLPDPTNYDVGAEATVESDPNGETSVYKLVDE
jgi:hypothetical protein